MILKSFDTGKINLNHDKFMLFYGNNNGLRDEVTDNLIKNKKDFLIYQEKEILENPNNFIENILSKSLFEDEKKIIIKRASDKIFKIVEQICYKSIRDLIIIIHAENLDKKSKLRSFFEKSKKYVCVAFYPDNEQTLSRLANEFLKQKKILLSSSNINLIIQKCNGDRESLVNELEKIDSFAKGGKKITTDVIKEITNLNENHSISELVDNCLAKNKRKLLYILNENNFTNEDCILITRVLLNKSKKILGLSKEYKIKKNLDLIISSARPPIFWKDKELTKQQINKWSTEEITKLIFKLNELELLIKKNFNHSINITTDFMLNQVSN